MWIESRHWQRKKGPLRDTDPRFHFYEEQTGVSKRKFKMAAEEHFSKFPFTRLGELLQQKHGDQRMASLS